MKQLFSLIIVVLTFSSNFAQVKTNFTQQDYDKFFKAESIPADLKDEKHVLVIVTPYTAEETEKNKAIKEIFDSLYKFKFVVEPAESKDFKTYKDKNVYRYSISMLEVAGDARAGDNAYHGRFQLSIIDDLKLYKGDADPGEIMNRLTNGGKKKAKMKDLQKEIKMEDIDITAIHDTGLEDQDKKLNNMLAYLAKKLNDFKK